MSKSSSTEDESAAWAQTLVTVTPQDDGFLREIKEDAVVSGFADTPLDLDTWNIELRRSLVIDTTKNNGSHRSIDPSELKDTRLVEKECQTYLQFPLVHRKEATTQTALYMEPSPTIRSFDGNIIREAAALNAARQSIILFLLFFE